MNPIAESVASKVFIGEFPLNRDKFWYEKIGGRVVTVTFRQPQIINQDLIASSFKVFLKEVNEIRKNIFKERSNYVLGELKKKEINIEKNLSNEERIKEKKYIYPLLRFPNEDNRIEEISNNSSFRIIHRIPIPIEKIEKIYVPSIWKTYDKPMTQIELWIDRWRIHEGREKCDNFCKRRRYKNIVNLFKNWVYSNEKGLTFFLEKEGYDLTPRFELIKPNEWCVVEAICTNCGKNYILLPEKKKKVYKGQILEETIWCLCFCRCIDKRHWIETSIQVQNKFPMTKEEAEVATFMATMAADDF